MKIFLIAIVDMQKSKQDMQCLLRPTLETGIHTTASSWPKPKSENQIRPKGKGHRLILQGELQSHR
jgi:hypothetical protein